jgi:hypothetical protein
MYETVETSLVSNVPRLYFVRRAEVEVLLRMLLGNGSDKPHSLDINFVNINNINKPTFSRRLFHSQLLFVIRG